jgi:hypothetical protein
MKLLKYSFIAILLGAISSVYAESVSFFVSNNTGTITLEQAYDRMAGAPQQELTTQLIKNLQVAHLEQGELKERLGAYLMSATQQVTGDNTEVFKSSPLQNLTKDEVFQLSQTLAKNFKQESVAVFIPNPRDAVANVQVKFRGALPSINEVTTLINQNLPTQYSQAYSLEINNDDVKYGNAKVKSIQWLGTATNNVAAITKAFPNAQILTKQGSAYLIYQDGTVQGL